MKKPWRRMVKFAPFKLLCLFLIVSRLFMVSECLATQSIWSGATNNSWGTATNWSNGVPTGIAEFDNSSLITTILLSANTSLAQLLFDANAAAHTINLSGKTLTLTSAITNNSAQVQTIINSTPSKSTLTLQNVAITGNVTITNVTNNSVIAFTGNSSANNTTITNAAGCTVDISGLGALSPTLTVGSLSGAGAVTLGTRTLIEGTLGTSDTISGVISGAGGSLTKAGAGILTLSGSNTYTGATTINTGTLRMGKANALATGSAVTAAAGTTFNLNNFSQSIGSLAGSGNVTFGTGTLTTGNDNTNTIYSGSMSGTGGLTKAGTGTFTLFGNNSYTGPTTINTGTLQLGVANAVTPTSALTVNAGSTFALNNFNQSLGSLIGAGNVTLGSATLTTGSDNTNTTFSGVMSGTGGLTKSGTGTLTLSGSNTYTGPTTINVGALQMGKANALATGTAVTAGAGTTFNLANFNQSVGSLTGAGNVTFGSGTFTTGNDNTNTTFSGIMSGTGGLTKIGTGIFTLSGANTYSGPTTINGGTLKGGILNALSPNSAFIVNAGSVLDLNNLNTALASLAGSGNVTLGSATLTAGNDNTNTTFSGIMSGAGGLTKAGTGIFTLSGANTYTGATIINGGTLQLGAANAVTPTSALTVNAGSTFALNNFNQSLGSLIGVGIVTLGSATLTTGSDNANTTFSGVMSGTGGLSKTGTGIFILSGSNTYTGPTGINSGELQMGKVNSLSTGTAVTAGAGTTFNLNNFSQSIGSLAGSGNTTLGTATLTTGNDNTNTIYSGIMSGTGGLTKAGTGIFTLSGANTYTGATIINGGTLQLGAANAVTPTSALTVNAGSTFALNNINQSLGSLIGAGNVTLGSATLTTGSDNTNTTFSGVMSGTGGLSKTGTGIFILSGSNTYAGPTTINVGTLQMGKANALATGTAVTAGAGTTFNLANFNQSVGSLAGAGNVTFGSGAFTTGNDNTNTTFSGIMSGTGGLTKTGTGTFTLSGANTYTGVTVINGGTLQLGAINAVTPTSVLTVNAGSTFALNNFNQSLASLAGAGNVTLGTATLSTGSGNTNTAYSGIMSGAGGLTKTGTGTFTLSGANTYSGPTTISAGTLRAGAVTAFSPNSAVIVNAGSTLALNNFNQSLASLAGAGNVTLGSAILTTGSDNTDTIYAGVMSGNGGGLTKVGTGIFTVSGANTYSGPTTVSLGTLKAGAVNAFSLNSDFIINAGSVLDLNDLGQVVSSISGSGNVTLGTGTLTTGDHTDTTFSGILSGMGGLTKEGACTFTLNGLNTYTGPTTINAQTLQMGIANSLSAATAVTVSGPATFNLANYNQSIGSLAGSGKVTLGLAVLTTGNDNTNTTYSGAMSGTGQLIKVGTGTFILSGNNSYTGSTTINTGILQMGKVNTMPTTTAVTVGAGTTFNLANFSQGVGSITGSGNVTLGSGILTTGNNNTDTSYSGVISGTGGLTKTGTSIFTLLGNNTFTGGTTINAGTLKAGIQNALAQTGAVTVNAGGVFDPNNLNQSIGSLLGIGNVTLGSATLTTGNDNTDTSYSGVISGTGGLIKVGTGILTISGNNTFTGGTTINAGTLKAGIQNTLAQLSAVTVNVAGIFDLNNFNQSIGSLLGNGNVTLGSTTLTTGNDNTNTTYSGVISGTGGLIKVGTGALTISGNNTFTGGTTINTGTLKAGIQNALVPTGSVILNAAGTFDLDNFNQDIGSLLGSGNVTLGAAVLTTGNDNTDTAYSGIMSGAGGLIKTGTGIFTLSGNNTFTGGTTINAGTLQGDTTSLQGLNDISLNGKLSFNQILADGTFTGTLAGTGLLEKQGPKPVTLNGLGTFTGNINIQAGTLLFNNVPASPPALLSTLTTQPQGTLMGSGVVQQKIVNNGLLSVGNPLGTGLESLTSMNGYEGTGTLRFNLDNQGNNSSLILDGGNTDLRQTNLDITSTTLIDALNTYELIRVQGAPLNSIQGPFLTIPQRVGKFIPEIAYNANGVVLSFDLQPTAFAAGNFAGNDGNVAWYIDKLSSIAEGPLEDFIFGLEGLSDAQLDDIFSQLNSSAQGSMVQAVNFGSSINTTVQERMNIIFTGVQPQVIPVSSAAFSPTTNKIPSLFKPSFVTNQSKDPSLTDTLASLFQDKTYQLPFTKGKSTAWAQGFTMNRLQKTCEDIPGFNADTGGLMVGVDSPILQSNVYVGASIGYGRGGVNFKQARGSSTIKSYLASIYTMYSTKDFYVGGSFSGSYNKYHANRQLPYLNLTAQSNYHGTEWTPHLGAGVNFKFTEVTVQPFVNIDYLTLHQGAYQEYDASFANLSVLSSSSSQLKSEAGFNVTKSFPSEKGNWTGLFKLSFIRTQPLKKSKLIAGFVGQPLTFETDNLNIKQNKVSPGVGLKYSLKNGLYLNGRYDAEISKKSVSQSVSLRLGYVF